MHRGTLFIWLFIILALTFALLVAWVSGRRAIREPESRSRVLAYAALAFGLWIAASYAMFLLVFGVAWGLAHSPPPTVHSFFPEGWSIYGFIAAYAALGAAILVILRKFPPNRPCDDIPIVNAA